MDLLNLLPRPTVDLAVVIWILCGFDYFWTFRLFWTKFGGSFFFFFGSDYSEVPASKPDREGFLGFVGAILGN